MNSKSIKITIIIVILVAGLVGYYAYLSNRRIESNRKDPEMTAIQNVLARDLSRDYPPTPKEVMKYYNELTKCYYSDSCTNDNIDSLAIKARDLYDEKLLEVNELGAYLIRIENEIADAKSSGRRLTTTTVAASTNVDFYTIGGDSFARILCTYTFAEGRQSETQRLIYLLRKDSDRRWKIYGWDLEENVDLNGDGVPGD